MGQRFEHFRGATFRLPATYLDDLGAPKSLVGVTITPRLEMGTGPSVLTAPILDVNVGAFVITGNIALTTLWDLGVWPLYLAYDQTILGQPQREVELVCLVHVKDAL